MIHRLNLDDGSDLGHFDHGVDGRASFVDAATGQQKSLPPVAFDPDSSAHDRRLRGRRLHGDAVLLELRRLPPPRMGARRPAGLRDARRCASTTRCGAARASAIRSSPPPAKTKSATASGRSPSARKATSIRPRVRKEYDLPDFFLDPKALERAGHSNPVSDIEFPQCSDDQVMLVAERGGVRNLGLAAENPFAFPHEARVLRYEADANGIWQPTGRYDVGFYDRKKPTARRSCARTPPAASPSATATRPTGRSTSTKPNEWAWMTGDFLCTGIAPCFNPDTGKREDGSEVDGAQGTPADAYVEVDPAQASQPYPATGEADAADRPAPVLDDRYRPERRRRRSVHHERAHAERRDQDRRHRDLRAVRRARRRGSRRSSSRPSSSCLPTPSRRQWWNTRRSPTARTSKRRRKVRRSASRAISAPSPSR